MKKTLSFMVMAFALLFAQCRKPEVKFPTPSAADEGTTVSMTVTAGPGSKTDITTAGAITWSTGDKLYVGDGAKYIGCLTLQGAGGSATGTFSGNVTLTDISEGTPQTFHFFYLGSDNSVAPAVGATSVNVLFNEQNIYKNGDKLENAKKFHIGYGSASGTVKDGVVTGINVTLVSKVALARFSFKKGGTGYSNALTLSGTNIYNDMTVNFNGSFDHGATPGNITLTAGHGERYVMLVPTGDATEQTLTFTGSAESGTGAVPGLKSNKFYGKTEPIAVTLTATTIHVTGVSLNENSLSLAVGGTETLTATVSPDNATNKSVTWSSSDESVATVADGTVTAVAAGTATITVTTVDGGKTATCTVTVTAPAPTHETVNFGTPNLNWSKYNLGVDPENLDDPWDWYGDYYAWGEVVPYYTSLKWTSATECTVDGWNTEATLGGGGTVDATKGYAWQSYSHGNSSFAEWSSVPYDSDNKLFPARDAATAAWGEGWRMPTAEEWKDLCDNNTFEWLEPSESDETYGTGFKAVAAGYLVVKGLGETIDSEVYMFLPAAGVRNGTSHDKAGSYGLYWSSSLYLDYPYNACDLYIDEDYAAPQLNNLRYFGFSVRPVR